MEYQIDSSEIFHIFRRTRPIAGTTGTRRFHRTHKRPHGICQMVCQQLHPAALIIAAAITCQHLCDHQWITTGLRPPNESLTTTAWFRSPRALAEARHSISPPDTRRRLLARLVSRRSAFATGPPSQRLRNGHAENLPAYRIRSRAAIQRTEFPGARLLPADL